MPPHPIWLGLNTSILPFPYLLLIEGLMDLTLVTLFLNTGLGGRLNKYAIVKLEETPSSPKLWFCPLLKNSRGNSYLKILDFFQLSIADAHMKKHKSKTWLQLLN